MKNVTTGKLRNGLRTWHWLCPATEVAGNKEQSRPSATGIGASKGQPAQAGFVSVARDFSRRATVFRQSLRLKGWVVVAILALPALAGCTTGTGSAEEVRLVVTPVATPTQTPLALPTSAPTTYTVKPGDTLSGIAAMFGVSVDDIVRANSITDPNVLSDGQALQIPPRSVEGTPTEQPVGSPSPQGSPVPVGSPTLPPPDVTPPLGPTTSLPTPGGSSAPGTTISPTAAP